MTAEIRFTLLGPVRAWRYGVDLDVGQAQQRAVLAVLLMSGGGQVTVDRLVDDVWGDDAPRTAVQLIRTYIHRLRKVLDTDTSGLIRSVDGGYTMTGDPESVDLAVFEQLVAHARAEHAAGHPAAAAKYYAEGLALWTGTPLAAVPGPHAETQRNRLGEVRLTAVEERLACEVEAGFYADAASQLAVLAVDHPLRERFRELHMTALYGSGRQAEALTVYQETARLLRNELGVDPGPCLRETHRRILAGEPMIRPATQLSSPVIAPQPPVVLPLVRPAQLPAALPRFTGRRNAVRRLLELAAPAHDAESRAADGSGTRGAVTCVVHGMAGIGKTALAVHAAHLLARRFPDGQLYVNLRGFDPDGAMDPHEALGEFLAALGVAPREIPPTLNARAALYRSLLAERRILVLLDNAGDAQHVRALLPGAPTCLTLITSRDQLPGLVATHQADSLQIDLFDEAEAHAYLAASVGADRVRGNACAAAEIIGYCAGLPLALAIAAARAAQSPHTPLTVLAAQLRGARGSLDYFSLERDPAADARHVFSWSYQALGADAARLFRLLSVHPGPDVTAPAAAALAAIPVERAAALLADLVRTHLATERVPGRYQCHDLLRAYAAELAEQHDSAAERDAAADRLLSHYVFTARSADRSFGGLAKREVVEVRGPLPGSVPGEITGQVESLRWFTAEYANLLTMVKSANARHADVECWLLAWYLVLYQESRGLWRDALFTLDTSMESAARIGDPRVVANVHVSLAHLQCFFEHFDETRRHLTTALDLELGSGEDERLVRARHALRIGRLYNHQGEHCSALAESRQGLKLAAAVGDTYLACAALSTMGWSHAMLGNQRQALVCCRAAVRLNEQIGDEITVFAALDSIGYALHRLGRYDEAVGYFRQALDVMRGSGQQYPAARTLDHLGETYLALSDRQAARAAWTEALRIYEHLEHARARGMRILLDALTFPPPPAPVRRAPQGTGRKVARSVTVP